MNSGRLFCKWAACPQNGQDGIFFPFIGLGIHWEAGMAQLLLHCILINGRQSLRGDPGTNDFAPLSSRFDQPR
jgi:hypothetical protein